MARALKLWIKFWNAEPPLGVVLTAVTGACLAAALIVLLALMPHPVLNIVP